METLQIDRSINTASGSDINVSMQKIQKNTADLFSRPNPSGMKIACIGSSITQHATDWGAEKMENDSRGYMTWLNALSGQRFYYATWPSEDGTEFYGSNKGVSGQFSHEILARVHDVIGMGVDICIVQNGTNDLSSVDYETVISNTKALYDQLLEAGIFVVALAILPRNASVGNGWEADGEARHKRNRVNAWKRDYVEARAGIIYIDPAHYLINQDDVNGEPLSGLFYDGTHTSFAGGYLVGRALNDALSSIFPDRPSLISGADNVYHTENPKGCMTPNPTFLGTGGTPGAGVTGTLPTGWELERYSGTSSTAAASVIKALDGTTNQVQIDITPAGNDETFYFRTDSATVTTGVIGGDWYQAEIDIEISGGYAGFYNVSLTVDEMSPGGVKVTDMAGYGSEKLPTNNLTLRLRTPPVKTKGTGGLRFRVEIDLDGTIAGSPVIKLSKPSLRSVQSPEVILNGG